MTKRKEHRGRRKGSRNKGYFYREKRGWFAKSPAGKFIPLADENGERLRDKNTPESAVKVAYARYLTSVRIQQPGKSGVTLFEVCDRYLAYARKTAAPATVKGRERTLHDFCSGYPGRFCKGSKPKPADRIHAGYGAMLVDDLKPQHVVDWQTAHGGWTSSGSRTRVQALKRALNFAKEMGTIEKNPIRGMKLPPGRARVTYLTDAQEKAILERCPRALNEALRVLIRTGMRPGEFAKLAATHIVDHGERMEFRFKAEEAKTRKPRIIRVSEPWIIELVRKLMKLHRGPIFRNRYGKAWKVRAMSVGFLRAVKKAKKAGIKFDDDCCLYSTRHTYAKRALCGYWRGQFINIETLARLMGNSPQVCRANYLQWTEDFQEPLWAAC